MAVLEHLTEIVVRVFHLVIHDHAVLFHRHDLRIDKTAVRLEPESRIPVPYLLVKFRVNVHRIFLNQFLAGLVVTL